MSQYRWQIAYNPLRTNGGGVVRSIEPFALGTLDIEPGDVPEDVRVDEEERELILSP